MSQEHVHPPYLHGTAPAEQERLLAQARFWRDLILAVPLPPPGARLLEIGCGVGAVLAVIAEAEPRLQLSGIDRSPAQIATARRVLAGSDHPVELVVGDAAALPWSDGHFEAVRLMWVVEHLQQPDMVLAEAHRVLRPGGTIDVIETDYASFRTSPPDPAIEAYLQAFVSHFARHGDPHAGLRLGPLLDGAGFTEVSVTVGGLHAWTPGRRRELAAAIDYLQAFIDPELEAMAGEAGRDPALVREGASRFRALASQPAAALSAAVYRGRGVRSGSSQPARAAGQNSRGAE